MTEDLATWLMEQIAEDERAVADLLEPATTELLEVMASTSRGNRGGRRRARDAYFWDDAWVGLKGRAARTLALAALPLDTPLDQGLVDNHPHFSEHSHYHHR